MYNIDEILIIVLVIGIVFIILPNIIKCNKIEGYSINTNYPEQLGNEYERPSMGNRNPNDYESLIYDTTNKTIMTGTQFQDISGIITPPWVAPAWDSEAKGPSSKEPINQEDYENDPRMIYNKCGLSCCSPQYPTAFGTNTGEHLRDNKYMASNFTCMDNTGGVGCLCMTKKQVDDMRTGYVQYDK